MANNPNELTIENSALMLIDHQPAVGSAVNCIDRTLLDSNATRGNIDVTLRVDGTTVERSAA